MPRIMTDHLESVLNAVTPREWEAISTMMGELDDSLTRRLLSGLYWEHLADVFAETAVMQRLEAQRRAWLDGVEAGAEWHNPITPRTKALFFDPETGVSRIDE